MTHSYSQESDIAERYLMGRLSDQERSSFEEHLIDCRECLDRVEIAERFRRGLKAVAAQDMASTALLMRTGFLARLARFSGRQRGALLASATLLLVGVAISIYFAGVKRTETTQGQLQASYAGLQREYAQQQQIQQKLNEQLQASEAQRQQLETLLGREREAHANASLASSATLPVFTLSMVRSTDISQEPSNTIAISRSVPAAVLLLELEPDAGAQSYRAALVKDGQAVWQARNLKLSGTDTIPLVLNSTLLTPGSYVLGLKACTSQHRCYPAASYSFRATTLR